MELFGQKELIKYEIIGLLLISIFSVGFGDQVSINVSVKAPTYPHIYNPTFPEYIITYHTAEFTVKINDSSIVKYANVTYSTPNGDTFTSNLTLKSGDTYSGTWHKYIFISSMGEYKILKVCAMNFGNKGNCTPFNLVLWSYLPSYYSEKKNVTNISKVIHSEKTFKKLPISKIEFYSTKPAKINVTNISCRGGLTLYKCFEINMNISESDLINGTIYWKVNESWTEKHNLSNNEIFLYKFEGRWIKQNTQFINYSNGFAYYKSFLNTFSIYGIGGEKKIENITKPPQPKENITMPKIEHKIVTRKTNIMNIEVIVGTIIALALLSWIIIRKFLH